MKRTESSATSRRFRLPRKNSCHEMSRFSKDAILSNIWRVPRLSLSLDKASILQRVKEGYLAWMNIVPHIAKGARYTIGARIENKFLDLLELSYKAYFTEQEEKSKKIDECILALDLIKFLIYIAWEAKSISHAHYEDSAGKLNEIGKMLGGWKKYVEDPIKKNRTL